MSIGGPRKSHRVGVGIIKTRDKALVILLTFLALTIDRNAKGAKCHAPNHEMANFL